MWPPFCKVSWSPVAMAVPAAAESVTSLSRHQVFAMPVTGQFSMNRRPRLAAHAAERWWMPMPSPIIRMTLLTGKCCSGSRDVRHRVGLFRYKTLRIRRRKLGRNKQQGTGQDTQQESHASTFPPWSGPSKGEKGAGSVKSRPPGGGMPIWFPSVSEECRGFVPAGRRHPAWVRARRVFPPACGAWHRSV